MTKAAVDLGVVAAPSRRVDEAQTQMSEQDHTAGYVPGRTVLRDGLVADGSGSEPSQADLVVEDGIVRDVLPPGGRYAAGTEIVECAGLVVAPGFVDIHTHSDLSLFSYPGNESRITQGVTTEAVGNCGMTPAPSGGDNAGLATVVDSICLDPELDWSWDDFAGWISALEALPKATNVVAHVGHGTSRFAVAGPQARPLSGDEMSLIDKELRRALDDGAIGVSVGLMSAPGDGATADELGHVASIVAQFDAVLSIHMRSYSGTALADAVREVIGFAESSGARIEISHLRQAQSRTTGSDDFARVLDLIDDARDRVDVTADAYPYLAGHANLIQLFPRELRGQGASAIAEFCTGNRQQATEMLAASGYALEDVVIMKAFATPDVVTKSAAEVSGGWSRLVDVIIENAGLVDCVLFGSRWSDVDLGYERAWFNVASDGMALGPGHTSSAVHPRSWGTFPAAYRRMRDAGIQVGEAVHRLTDGPARRIGTAATLARGRRADITIFDDSALQAVATYQSPAQAAVGIRHVFVGGSAVIRDGHPTAARPGRLFRRDAAY